MVKAGEGEVKWGEGSALNRKKLVMIKKKGGEGRGKGPLLSN